MKLPTTENELKKLSDKFFEAHGFIRCIRTIDNTHIDRTE